MSDHDENSVGTNNRMLTENDKGHQGFMTTNTCTRTSSTGVGARKRPPIPSFGLPVPDYTNFPNDNDGTNTSTTSTSSNHPTVGTVGVSTNFTQEEDPHRGGPLRDGVEDDELGHPMDMDDEDDEDGSVVSSGAGSLSSGSVSSDDDDSSSSEDEEDARLLTLSLEERMFRNQQRNAEFLRSLNQKYQDQVPTDLHPPQKKQRKKSSSTLQEEEEDAPVERRRGMLRRKPPQNGNLTNTTCTTTTAPVPPLVQRLQSLTRQYPYREGQIRRITALLHGAMGAGRGAIVQQQQYHDDELVVQVSSNNSNSTAAAAVHVPAPIFVSGPRGAGKTSIVKDVLAMLSLEEGGGRRRGGDNQQRQHHCCGLHSAYINCVTLEPSSIERLVADAYKQLRPREDDSSSTAHGGRHGRRLLRKQHQQQQRRQTTSKLPHSPKPQNDPTTTTPALTVLDDDSKDNNTAYNNDVETSIPSSVTAATLTDSMMSDEPTTEEFLQPRLQPRRAAKIAGHDDTYTSTINKVAAASGNSRKSTGGGNKNKPNNHRPRSSSHHSAAAVQEDDPHHRTEDTVETSHSAVVAFGRSLHRYFGGGASSPRAAVLVLDHAERLLTVSARKQAGDKANCLAELLMLPKVMRLNLTIVVISRYALLYGTRLDNIASPEKSTATLSGSIGGLTIQFPAYKDHEVMKRILKTEKLLPFIIGTKSTNTDQVDKGRSQFMEKVIDGFLSALVQFLSDSTIDVNEFVRVGRSLWPVFIEPLHPTRIQGTMASLAVPSLTEGAKDADEKRDREILEFLGRRFLGEIGKLSTDLTHLTMDSPLLAGTETGPITIPTRAYTIADLKLPFLRTCLLLAAFICQNNRAENDKKVFSVHGNGKRKRTRKGNEGNDEEVAFASTGGGIEQLKSLRPRPFLVERVFSIFVTLVRLNPDSAPQWCGTKGIEYNTDSLGSSRLYEDLRSLIDLGVLHPVAFSGDVRGEQINLNGARFWCSLTVQEAEHLAEKVGIPLDSYLV